MKRLDRAVSCQYLIRILLLVITATGWATGGVIGCAKKADLRYSTPVSVYENLVIGETFFEDGELVYTSLPRHFYLIHPFRLDLVSALRAGSRGLANTVEEDLPPVFELTVWH